MRTMLMEQIQIRSWKVFIRLGSMLLSFLYNSKSNIP